MTSLFHNFQGIDIPVFRGFGLDSGVSLIIDYTDGSRWLEICEVLARFQISSAGSGMTLNMFSLGSLDNAADALETPWIPAEKIKRMAIEFHARGLLKGVRSYEIISQDTVDKLGFIEILTGDGFLLENFNEFLVVTRMPSSAECIPDLFPIYQLHAADYILTLSTIAFEPTQEQLAMWSLGYDEIILHHFPEFKSVDLSHIL